MWMREEKEVSVSPKKAEVRGGLESRQLTKVKKKREVEEEMGKERQVSGEGEKSRRRERGEREEGMRESVQDLCGKGDEDVRREEALHPPAAPAGSQSSVSAPRTEAFFLLAVACGPVQESDLGGIISLTFSRFLCYRRAGW